MFGRPGDERNAIYLLWNLLALVLGCAVYALGLFLNTKSDFGIVLKDLGQTVTGAAILFFLFNWISEQNTSDLIKASIKEYLGTIFRRLTAEFFASSIRDYRWDCYLSLPRSNDPYPQYLYQTISLSLTTQDLPDHLLFVIGQSDEDDALLEYFENPKCFLRWPMSTLNGELDLDDSAAGFFGPLAINGRPFETSSSRFVRTSGGGAIEYRVDVPPFLQRREANLSFTFMVRKLSVSSEVINVICRLYKNCEDAEFRLHSATSLNAAKIHCYTTEVTPLLDGVGYHIVTNNKLPVGGLVMGSSAIFRQPLQRGSNIRFEVRRNLDGLKTEEQRRPESK